MDPVRSSLSGGVVATAVLAGFLDRVDLLFSGADVFAFTAFTTPCALVGQPYCAAGSATASALTTTWFLALFVLAWPLLFAGFTWGLPGESGATHGAIFGLVLFAGYLARGLSAMGPGRTVVVLVGLAYLVYGLVLGVVYDRLAGHRTLLETESVAGTGD